MLRRTLISIVIWNLCKAAAPYDWSERLPNGAYQFGFATGDSGSHFRTETASADNTVAGRYGFRDPATGAILQTVYTAGRRGFRARGPHIARRMDLSQNGGPIRPPDGQYRPELDSADPTEDKGFDFVVNTPDQKREEHADQAGTVQGKYSYVDDVGERHDVEYTAGAATGFLVKNSVPDTVAKAQGGPLRPQGKYPRERGFTAIQKALDGSYRFAASGPDQKHTEVSDALGNRRGSYSYLDDKGVPHKVDYIAGPGIGYQVINKPRPPWSGVIPPPLGYPLNWPDPGVPGFTTLQPSKDDHNDNFGNPAANWPNLDFTSVKPSGEPSVNNNIFGSSTTASTTESQNGGSSFNNGNSQSTTVSGGTVNTIDLSSPSSSNSGSTVGSNTPFFSSTPRPANRPGSVTKDSGFWYTPPTPTPVYPFGWPSSTPLDPINNVGWDGSSPVGGLYNQLFPEGPKWSPSTPSTTAPSSDSTSAPDFLSAHSQPSWSQGGGGGGGSQSIPTETSSQGGLCGPTKNVLGSKRALRAHVQSIDDIQRRAESPSAALDRVLS